ncbi:hypothetical protein Tco_1246311 [Tanacetum coccineum]
MVFKLFRLVLTRLTLGSSLGASVLTGEISDWLVCTLGKSKKSSHQPKAEDTNKEKLYLLYMDLCGLMLVQSINGKNAVSLVQVAATPSIVDIVGLPSSTTIDLDATSTSSSSTKQQQKSSIISQGVEEPIPNAQFDDPCHEPLHDVSTSQESSSNV